MKYRRILLFSAIAFACGLTLRTLQVFYITDGATGFFKSEQARTGYLLTGIIAVIMLLIAVMGATVRRYPKKMPKVNIGLGICSIALGIGTVFEILSAFSSARMPMWQILLFNLSGYLAAGFFVFYGIKAFYNYRLPRALYVIPLIFWIIKLVYTFTAVSTIALITDNVFMLASYCAVLVFMLQFAKLANNLDANWSFKKLMVSGLVAVYLSALFSLPRFFAILTGHNRLLHETVASALSSLLTALFITAFLCTYFSYENLSRRKRRTHSVKYMENPKHADNFYIGGDK